MDKNKEIIKAELLKLVETQLKENFPAEVNIAFNRLTKMGYTEEQIKKQLVQCLTIEMLDKLKFCKPTNVARYVRNLNNLPNNPSKENIWEKEILN